MFAYWENGKEEEGFIRYLTPIECERLMGLPDNYTKYGADGNIILDSARYKALGNAIALPCVENIMAGIKEELTTLVQNEQKLEEKDGQGDFNEMGTSKKKKKIWKKFSDFCSK